MLKILWQIKEHFVHLCMLFPEGNGFMIRRWKSFSSWATSWLTFRPEKSKEEGGKWVSQQQQQQPAKFSKCGWVVTACWLVEKKNPIALNDRYMDIKISKSCYYEICKLNLGIGTKYI